MMNMTRERAPMAPSGLPYDLSIWVGKSTLVKLTLEVTTEFTSLISRGAPRSHSQDDFPPAMLLTLMTYCYATGAVTSSDIERRTYDDDIVRYLAANRHPDRDVLRNFRRRWRSVIKECLLNLFAVLWQHRYPIDGQQVGNCDPPAPARRGSGGSPQLVRLFVCEAERRIDRAVQYDSMELDE